MIEIHRMQDGEQSLFGTLENKHLVGESAIVKLTRTGFQIDYRPLARSVWRTYPEDTEPGFMADDFLARPDRDAYFAWLEEKLVGQICLVKNWNQLALIWDIRVSLAARRRGVGAALMEMAEQWAWKMGMKGVMLETQDTNPGACQFYGKCGYVLGGVDTMLYGGTQLTNETGPNNRDAALFFYKMFD